jgi:hypothetical protein
VATSCNDVCINANFRYVYSQIQLLKMSANNSDDWEDEEEEEDFVPEDCDDEEGDDCVDDDEEDDDPEDFPSVLQGEFFMDRTKGLCYEQDGVFCLVCKTSIPARTFAFEAPVIDSPLVFAGWINDPNRWMEFEVIFSKEQMSMDPLQIQLLEAQEQKQLCYGSSTTTTTTDNDSIDDNWMEKKSLAKGNLKAPPSYSVKEKSANSIDTVRKCSSKNSTSKSTAGDVIETNEGKMSHQNDMIFVFSGSQIGNDGIDDISISFRGSYRCPSKASVERLYLICPIQTVDGSTSTSVAGGTTAVAAASTKRNRSRNDDESVEGNIGVAYQELIDLHDDTRLSTDELRKRYYGSGDKKGDLGKRYAPDNKRLKGTSNRGHQKKDVEDDDDDDAYGF